MALRIYTEMVEALRYKLRTFGVNPEGPAEVYCDNKSGVTKSSVPESVLNKGKNFIWYHIYFPVVMMIMLLKLLPSFCKFSNGPKKINLSRQEKQIMQCNYKI